MAIYSWFTHSPETREMFPLNMVRSGVKFPWNPIHWKNPHDPWDRGRKLPNTLEIEIQGIPEMGWAKAGDLLRNSHD